MPSAMRTRVHRPNLRKMTPVKLTRQESQRKSHSQQLPQPKMVQRSHLIPKTHQAINLQMTAAVSNQIQTKKMNSQKILPLMTEMKVKKLTKSQVMVLNR